MIRKLLLASTFLVTGVVAATAADLPVQVPAAVVYAPVFNWTGFYVGAHAGYGWTDGSANTTGVFPVNVTNVLTGARPGSVGLDGDGFVGGGQLGYNFQFGQVVVGIEADISYTDISGSAGYLSAGGFSSGFAHNMDYLGTVRGRIGYAWDRFLVYGTGGFAYGRVNAAAVFLSNAAGAPVAFAGSTGETATGYTVGGGVEYALPTTFSLFNSSAVTIRAEYLYYDLGTTTVAVNPTAIGVGAYTSTFDNTGHIIRGGINIKF